MRFKEINTFMAVGAHCDDVDLRCGGTFSRLAREGKSGCYVVAVENAYTGPHYHITSSREALAVRRAESSRASAILGADRLEWLEFKSFYFSTPAPRSCICPSFDSMEAFQAEMRDVIFTGLPPVANADRFPACCRRLNQLIKDCAPQVVFTHSPDDRHPDHYALSRFVEFIVGEQNKQGANIDIYFWEPGSGGPIVEYAPDTFVELSEEDINRKQNAINCYLSQLQDGIVNTFAADRAGAYGGLVNLKYAEAFRKGRFNSGNPWKGMPNFLLSLGPGFGRQEIYPLPACST